MLEKQHEALESQKPGFKSRPCWLVILSAWKAYVIFVRFLYKTGDNAFVSEML